jgi:hypothetical protein
LRVAAHRFAQARFACFALAQFEQASAEFEPRRGIARLHCEHAPIGVGRGGIFAVQDHGLREASQDVEPLRRQRLRLQQDRAGATARIALLKNEREVEMHFDALGSEFERAFEHRDRLVMAPGVGELTATFEESRQKRRPSRRGSAQLLKGFFARPAAASAPASIVSAPDRRRGRATRCSGATASVARFCIISARARIVAATALFRFALNAAAASRSASSKRCIRRR